MNSNLSWSTDSNAFLRSKCTDRFCIFFLMFSVISINAWTVECFLRKPNCFSYVRCLARKSLILSYTARSRISLRQKNRFIDKTNLLLLTILKKIQGFFWKTHLIFWKPNFERFEKSYNFSHMLTANLLHFDGKKFLETWTTDVGSFCASSISEHRAKITHQFEKTILLSIFSIRSKIIRPNYSKIEFRNFCCNAVNNRSPNIFQMKYSFPKVVQVDREEKQRFLIRFVCF